MMPPYAYRDARMNAPIHIQGRILGYDGLLTVRVTRVLKGFGRLMWPGRELKLNVSIEQPGPPILGGTIYTPQAVVSRARFVEAFLGGVPPDVVWDQIKFFDKAPPRFTGDPAEERFIW
jgi:hypothetical protein